MQNNNDQKPDKTLFDEQHRCFDEDLLPAEKRKKIGKGYFR